MIEAISQGETKLFHNLILPYEQAAYRTAFCLLRDSAHAEDVVQEACIRAYRNLHSFRMNTSFGEWLTSIVLNEALLRLRDKMRLPSNSIDVHAQEEMPSVVPEQ